ncbi:zinc finger protein 91 [Trichonephila clavipes]|nr:zinc finger protein 91 [Trichonephila clavipes]
MSSSLDHGFKIVWSAVKSPQATDRRDVNTDSLKDPANADSEAFSAIILRHLLIHTKEKAHICDICNKDFSRRDTLKAHLRIHTNEMPYSCELCNKAFSQSSTLKTHLLIHTKEKPHI